jgi:transcriptional regulator
MYIPEPFREDRLEALHAFIRRHSFGILVSSPAGALEANHLPLLLETERGPLGTLVGHMARANGQWRSLESDGEALVVFPGPHAYVSPSWYETHPSVPTWNYAAVHAYGTPHLVQEPAALRSILRAMVQTYEASLPEPWPMDLPDEFTERMLNAIIGFEINITRLEGKRKLSQNRPEADRRGAVAGLARLGDPQSAAIAALMQQALSPNT